MQDLLTSNYDYFLPAERIASFPASPKESAKLLVYNRVDKSIAHSDFWHFRDFLPKETLLIFNDTKVLPARIYGNKISKGNEKGAKIEALFHREKEKNIYLLQFRGRLKVGDKIAFENGVIAEILEDCGMGFKMASFFQNNKPLLKNDFFIFLESFGHIPLPPYIKRKDEALDKNEYQSVFAKNLGAIAAPTASLHFSEDSFKGLQSDFDSAWVTLHVGAGTFIGVGSENILEHKMHKESFFISKATQEKIKNAKHITAIGTTSTRVLEYFCREKKESGECDLFLHPQNKPQITNALLTNFHLPKTTLLMLVASFIGLDEVKRVYKEAIQKEYRFYSYGDGMLIL